MNLLIQPFPTSRLSALTIALCWFLLAQSNLEAQQFIVRQQVGGLDRNQALYQQFMQQLDMSEKSATNRINCQLVDIDQACQLTDAQQKKLKVASKGAIESYMASTTEKIKETARQSGFDFEPGTPPEINGNDDQNNGALAQNIFAVNVAIGGNNGTPPIEDERIWKMSVKKVLTDDQNQKLSSWQEQRKRNIQQTAVASFVARVDMKLLLSPEQRDRLTSWIDEHHGAKLATRFEQQQTTQPGFVVLNQMPVEKLATVGGPVAEILNESQCEVWASSFRTELDQLKPQIRPAIQAIPAIKMVPGVRIQVDEDN